MIIRDKTRQNGYSIVSNHCLRNEKLSAKSKGIWAYIMTLPDDWQLYASELKKHFTDGRDSISSGIEELENHGYVVKSKKKDESGQWDGWDYTFFEEPQDNPKSENPNSANLQLLNTNNNQLLTNTKSHEENPISLKAKSYLALYTTLFQRYHHRPRRISTKDSAIAEQIASHCDEKHIETALVAFFESKYWYERKNPLRAFLAQIEDFIPSRKIEKKLPEGFRYS